MRIVELQQLGPNRASEFSPPPADAPVFRYVLLKLAARCNIKCTYCYWFRDQSVYTKPPLLTLDAENALIGKLASHVLNHRIPDFFILFHGGEPLLFGKARFRMLCHKLRYLSSQLAFRLQLAVTTNGMLVDSEWAELFREYSVGVTVSIDGPAPVHNASRVDSQGRGTFDRVMKGLATLRSAGVEPGALAVCRPLSDPREICGFFVDTLGLKSFDILVPDATHEDAPDSIAYFYKTLFDLWYDVYSSKGVRIRYLESISKGLLGIDSRSESIGYGPTSTLTMLTDGSLEPLDVLRTAGTSMTKTAFNIFDHELQHAQRDKLWREVHDASLALAAPCLSCAYRHACGGGHIASRWSRARRFDNPSVYCDDIKEIMSHAWSRIAPDLRLEPLDHEAVGIADGKQSTDQPSRPHG